MQVNYKPNATLDNMANDFLRDARTALAATSGFDELSVYVNFAHGDEGPRAWYTREKLDRLTSLKRRWDPMELFSFYQPVPLQFP